MSLICIFLSPGKLSLVSSESLYAPDQRLIIFYYTEEALNCDLMYDENIETHLELC